MPSVHDEKFESKEFPAEQTDKIRIYRIIDTLYKFIMASGKGSYFYTDNQGSLNAVCNQGTTVY